MHCRDIEAGHAVKPLVVPFCTIVVIDLHLIKSLPIGVWPTIEHGSLDEQITFC